MKKEDEPHILYLSTYPPRECGIATFTKDISDAVEKRFFPTLRHKIAAVNNKTSIFNYPIKVSFQMCEDEIIDYLEVAKKVNKTENIKIINIQHEYGIFGGKYGDYLLAFLEVVKKPVFITFHSVLPNPNKKLKKITQEIAKRVKCVIVMTKKSAGILREDYKITTPIHVIPHGIPNVPLETQTKTKKILGLKKKKIIVSFGMLGPGKGYEYFIEALPKIISKFPEVVYLILGETHPNIRKTDGENYRNFLEEKASKLNLQNHVKFYNKYLSLREIIQYLKSCDVYVCPNNDPNQSSSGTISYAMGCGRAVVSTPSICAKEIVNENRGRLAKFKDPNSFAENVIDLLSNENSRRQIERNAYHYTRRMVWSNIAASYGRIIKSILSESGVKLQELPRINIKHLKRMTDGFGVIQFAKQHIPDINSGYTVDDNARALLVCAMHFQKFQEYEQLRLIKIYLDYIDYVKGEDGRIYNFVDKEKKVDKSRWSEDAHGRALWALGYVYSLDSIPTDLKNKSEKLFLESLGAVSEIFSPRALAFVISGLYYYNKEKKSNEIIKNVKRLADYLVTCYKSSSNKDWKWFEPYLTYSNSKLSEALFYAYDMTKEKHYLEFAEESLNFLISKTFEGEIFVPIGQKGWYVKDKEKSKFDQQPVDAGNTVQTLITAYKITKNKKYEKYAMDSFQWFLGKNVLNQIIYNESTGGCHDGIGENSININQGSESTLSYLIARLSLVY